MQNKKLFQILLPLNDREGNPFPMSQFQELSKELTEHFGGLTSYSRSPAKGFWKDSNDAISVDEIIVYEVLSEGRHSGYWKNLKIVLEKKFEQDEIMIRCSDIELI